MATAAKFALKPLRPILDRQNPMTRGLVLDCPLFERGGTVAHDLAQNRPGTIVTLGTGAWETGLYGADLLYGASNAESVDFTTLANTNSQTTLSVETLWYATGLGGGSLGRLFAKGNTSQAYLLAFMDTSTLMEIWTGWGSQGIWTIPITENAWHHMVVTYNFSSTANTPVVYMDGVQITATLNSTPSGAAPVDDTNFSIGNRLAHDRSWAGKISYCRIWNRILNAQEAKALAANPWCIYDTSDMGENT